jgi:hypothetical protein
LLGFERAVDRIRILGATFGLRYFTSYNPSIRSDNPFEFLPQLLGLPKNALTPGPRRELSRTAQVCQATLET